MWDGTKKLSGTGATVAISIHPSRVGWDADVWDFARRYGKFQSTHPVWDGTRRQGDRMHARQHFNPPIPCGMGLPSCPCTSAVDHFNPPIPCGMGRIYIVKSLAGFLFQSTHPVWDGTPLRSCWISVVIFQSTHPVWDGTRGLADRGNQQRISIHPSRVGWDIIAERID